MAKRERAEFLLLDPLDKLYALGEIMEFIARREEISETMGMGICKMLIGIADEIHQIGVELDEAA